MKYQADSRNIITYPNRHLVRMNQSSIHRMSKPESSFPRTFVKVSVSEYKYNLIGNAHNYGLDYKWDMKPRLISRNHPVG